jgi:TonB-linked SusC/RagA family outer membrane protein
MNKLFYSLTLLLLVAGSAWAQRTVSGKVTAEDGEPLIGVNVLAKGTQTGTASDLEGNYSITLPEGVTILQFSYTGYRTTELEVGAANVLDVSLQPGISIDEVVVVGYGTQIKSTLTGNIAKVSGEQIEALPVTSVEQALQGKSAGVFIESVNGKPGGQVRMRVRGSSSITASNQPLFVVDGIPLTTRGQTFAGSEGLNLSGGSLNPLADLNFNDIESIEILKDASAGAIYGSRAANGVVLITTKKGKSGRTVVDLNVQTGFSNPTNKREFLNREEFIDLMTQSAIGAGRYEFRLFPEDFANEQEAIDGNLAFVNTRFRRYAGFDDNWRTATTNVNWQDLAFQEAMSSQATLSARGGTDRTRFFASASWSDQEGILIGNNFERLSGRLNLDQQLSEKVNFGFNVNIARTFTDQVSDDNAFSTPMQLVALAPLTPVRDENGELNNTPVTTYYNGLIDLEDAQRDITSFRTLANAYVRYQIVKGLYLNGDIGVDIYNLKDNAFFGSRTDGGNSTNGYGTAFYTQTQNVTSKLFANYSTAFGNNNLDLTAGFEFQKSETDVARVEGQEFPLDDLKTIASAADIAEGSSIFDQFSFLSYFARLNYNFSQKYLLTLSGRVDGSSRFGANNRFGFFPAASVGWVLSEEGFLQNSNTFSFLKLRASYGLTGNAEIANFGSLGLFGGEGYNGTPGLQPTQIANADLEWEKSAQLDIGLDFGLLNNRVNGELDYYEKNTTDLLLDVPVPGSTGFRTQLQNIGEIQNRGFEIVLNTNNLVGAFKWNTSINFARNINEVKALAPGQDIIDAGSSRQMNVVKVGEAIGAFYGAEYAGVDPDNGDALWFINAEGGGRETTNDFTEANFVILGNPNPDFIYGFTNNFSFKGFSLDVIFQGVSGNEIHKQGDIFMACNACWFDNQTRDQLTSWRNPGDVTRVPEARLGYSNGDNARSSRYLSPGSYLRLRTLTFGYEFPNAVLSRLKLSRLRLYATGQNLLTFTDYDGWDPEVSSDAFVTNTAFGIDFYSAPQPRTITFGLNLGF